MALDDGIRERVVLFGGKLAGVDCPNCEFDTRDVDIDVHAAAEVTCPECGTTILTDAEASQLRQAGKL